MGETTTTFADRLVIERDELKGRADKLRTFIEKSETYARLGSDDRNLLFTQLGIMNEYLNILNIRIRRIERR